MHSYTPDNITELQPYEILCGGTNEQGKHGGGLAKIMHRKWGYPWGKAEGLHGQIYGLPTKSTPWKTLPLDEIKVYVDRYIQHASQDHNHLYLTTRIGCGLAGYNVADIAPLFFNALYYENIILPEDFHSTIRRLWYVVYYNTHDFPGDWILKRLYITDDGSVHDPSFVKLGKTREDLQQYIPISWAHIPPSKDDDPVIKEIWVSKMTCALLNLNPIFIQQDGTAS